MVRNARPPLQKQPVLMLEKTARAGPADGQGGAEEDDRVRETVGPARPVDNAAAGEGEAQEGGR